jgi:hypothetical protein
MRRAECLLGALAVLGAGVSALLLPLTSFVATVLFILITTTIVTGLWLQGWLGGRRRLATIAWLPDGRWQLCDARHTKVIAELRADSRVGVRWLWLRWNAESARQARCRSMLLVRGDIPDDDLRRLVVRLRQDGLMNTLAHAPVHTHAMARRKTASKSVCKPAARPQATAEFPVRDDDF